MKLSRILVSLVAIAVILSACGETEKQKVTNYINSVTTIDNEFKKVSDQMDADMQQFQSAVADGTLDGDAVKAKLADFGEKMKASKAKVEALSVPEKAQAMHTAVVARYDAGTELLTEVEGMVDVMVEMMNLKKEMEADPKKAPEVQKKMMEIMKKMAPAGAKLQEIAERGKKADETMNAEKEKLVKEFEIKVADNKSGGEEEAGEE